MTAPHDRPYGRPIHPECPTTRHPDVPCECATLWRGWDGTRNGLESRIAAIAANETRRYDRGGVTVDEEDLHGFWRESERLKTALANLG